MTKNGLGGGITVSVIIPVYNVAPYLREALDSVVNQTYPHLELLIIDDGSTDGSGAICDEYRSDPRVTVIHQTHQNVSVARNAGLVIATGDYITFLDPDDAYLPSFIQTMLDTILKEKSDIVICKYRIYHTAKKMKWSALGVVFPSISSGLYNRAQALEGLLDGKIGVEIWNKLYTREIWDNIRFPEELCAGSDNVVSFHAFFNCSSVYVIEHPLYMYRKRSGSLTEIYSTKILRSRFLASSYVFDLLRSHLPETISKQQIRQYEEKILKATIISYAKCYEKEGSDYLKKQATDMADEIEIENCGFKTRTAYFIMRHCPGLLKFVDPAHKQIKLFVRKMNGR